MTEKNDALKPCPFCGAEGDGSLNGHLFFSCEGEGVRHRIKCTNCGAEGGRGNNNDDAAYEWNTRAALPALQTGEGWMPIESAPHETDVLLFIPPAFPSQQPRMEVGYASAGEVVNDISNRWWHGLATRWQPLPPPPVEDETP